MHRILLEFKNYFRFTRVAKYCYFFGLTRGPLGDSIESKLSSIFMFSRTVSPASRYTLAWARTCPALLCAVLTIAKTFCLKMWRVYWWNRTFDERSTAIKTARMADHTVALQSVLIFSRFRPIVQIDVWTVSFLRLDFSAGLGQSAVTFILMHREVFLRHWAPLGSCQVFSCE